jgi:gamma-tubulin complex component 3
MHSFLSFLIFSLLKRLFRKITTFINKTINGGGQENGLVGQSLCYALQEEMNDYYRLVAVLEAQMNEQIDELEELKAKQLKQKQSFKVEPATTSSTLTLRRLLVWSQEPMQRLRLMASIVDSTAGLKGASLASSIEKFSKHGDPFVASFIKRIMKEVCLPIYAMLRRWLFEGELNDPHSEFFITTGSGSSGGGGSSSGVDNTNIWYSKYKLNLSMLPSWFPNGLAVSIVNNQKKSVFLRFGINCVPNSPPPLPRFFLGNSSKY